MSALRSRRKVDPVAVDPGAVPLFPEGAGIEVEGTSVGLDKVGQATATFPPPSGALAEIFCIARPD